jgi:S-DNA-T family DNA segregation ATPase FtsK/SpoIIIE
MKHQSKGEKHMNTLAIFNGGHMAEFSAEAKTDEIHIIGATLDYLNANTPFAAQMELKPNVPQKLDKNLMALLSESENRYYSTVGISPVRIGNSACDHIQLHNSTAALAFYGDRLSVLDGKEIYLNGKKISQGDYKISPGDSMWVGCVKITAHKDYIQCAGAGYSANLNIRVATPEPYVGFPDYKRSPRIIKRPPMDDIEIKSPAKKEKDKKWALLKVILPPLMTSSIMVGGSMLIGRGLFVLISAAAMLVSVVFSATMFISDRKERRKKEAMRDDNYDKYLLDKRKEIYKAYEAQRESLLFHYLSPKEIEQEVLSYSSRIYERAANDGDFLTLSLGYGEMPTTFKLKYEADADNEDKDPLVDEMKELGDSYKDIPAMPMVIDLKNAHLGLVGDKKYIHYQLSAILAQLCFYQSYHDIEVIFLLEEEHRPAFEWARWYPHLRIKNINVTGLISTENHRDQALGNIAQVLKMRKQKQEEEKKDSRYLPHYIFIIDNPKLIINHSIMEYLQTPDTNLGFSLVYTTHLQANLPENIKTVFLLTGGDYGTLVMNEGHLLNTTATIPSLKNINLEAISRKTAPLRHSQGVSTQIPESVSFFELYGVKRPEEIPVEELWSKNACHKSLAVPLGLRGKDDIVALNLHEKAHGPHGLVAGTTGSGKSEIVQSYILSLAVNFHPHEVGFLLIDYKGGGMANLFVNLPHLLGTITNLDGSESMRALASIKSELARRQRIFNDHNVNNINQYTKLFKAGEATLPMPHLFIISDEFAELKKEQPDFMAELVSTARIGRSLGVHLILATQKPTGVVDDQIWSNSKFKLALKVANESDSNEVLKTPDAARITQPGRAYLQVGNNEIYELFQSAYSGAPYSESVVERGFDNRVYMINRLGQGILLNQDLSLVDTAEDSRLTQLDVTVNHINNLHSAMKSAPVDRPWLPPLTHKIVTAHIKTGRDVGLINTTDLTAPLGMVDIPEEQNQKEYAHSFADDGNLAVFAASGFGKSTVLMNIALTLASKNSPQLLNYFVMDYGNSALAQLRSLPHTADYLTIDDGEKLEKLEKLLAEELKKRKQLFASVNAINFKMYNEIVEQKLPAVIVFIDNCDIVREVKESLEETLAKLTRDGVGVGIYVVIAASRPSAVRYSVINNFKNKLAMFMFDISDVHGIVGRCAYTLPETKGRAMIKLKDAHVAQLYLPVAYEDEISYVKSIGKVIDDIDHHNSAPKAIGVRIVPEVVAYTDLVPYAKTAERLAILGFDIESTEPAYFDLSITAQLIVGGPATGKTNMLKLLLKQMDNNDGNVCFVADSRAADLHEYEDMPHIAYMCTESHLDAFYDGLSAEVARRASLFEQSGLRIKDFCASQPATLALIDDGDNFIELCKPKEMDMQNLITKAMEMGITFITTTMANKLRGYDGITSLLKGGNQAGFVLGNPGEQSLYQILAPRGYRHVIDIGYWFKRGDVRQVKLPFVQ